MNAIQSSGPETPRTQAARGLSGQICWMHGTNSAVLSIIPATNYSLIPTGPLLDQKIAPMSGEIEKGGLGLRGVNQQALSGTTIKNIAKSWNYAKQISHSFTPPRDFHEEFLIQLGNLKKFISDSNLIPDCILVKILRLKQWDFKFFNELYSFHKQMIGEIIAQAKKLHLVTAPQYARMLHILNNSPPEIQFQNEEDRRRISKPFPILFASTSLPSIPLARLMNRPLTENVFFGKVEIGTDITMIFTEPQYIEDVENWLNCHKLKDKVAVYPSSLIERIEKIVASRLS